MVLNRIERLKQEFDQALERFGSPELNMAQRRQMLKQLKEMETELNQYYKLEE